MIRTHVLFGLLLLVTTLLAHRVQAQDAATYKPDPGPWKVETLDETWHDHTRTKDSAAGREVLVRIYLPTPASSDQEPEKHPLIVFSHGYGGSRDGYEYFGRHLASHGYVVIHPQHHGSDGPAVMQALRDNRKDDKKDEKKGGERKPKGPGPLIRTLDEGVSDPDNLINRPRDISFVIDHSLKHERLAPLIDPSKIGVAGHSFGSYTSMAIAGMLVNLLIADGGAHKSFHDERVKAIIAMSPQGPGVMGVDQHGWDKITIPVLMLTGSKDMGQGQRAVDWRLTPYDKIKGPDTFLVYITDATHMTFSGAGAPIDTVRGGPKEVVQRHLGFVKQACTAFMDAYLRNDTAAKQWLQEKKLIEVSAKECDVRWKGSAQTGSK